MNKTKKEGKINQDLTLKKNIPKDQTKRAKAKKKIDQEIIFKKGMILATKKNMF